MAENENGEVAPFDPLNIPIITEFHELTIDEVRSKLEEVKTKEKPEEKLELLSHAISGLNMKLENELFDVQNEPVRSKSVKITTLPITAGPQECISTIQPAAWLQDFPGGLYDPDKDQICINSVGHWQGKAESLNQFLCQSIKTPCFIAYHIIAVIALILSFVIAFTNSTIKGDKDFQKKTVAIISAFSIGYDVLAIVVIIILEAFFPDDPAPFEATKVQESVHEIVSRNLQELVANEDANTLQMWSSDANTTPTQYAGYFILNKFYDPALTLLNKGIFNGLKGLFTEKNAKDKSWKQFEELLNLYRFMREISDSQIQGYEVIGQKKKNMVKIIISGIKTGNKDVHEQLLRLLALATETPEQREETVSHDPKKINMRHYLGTETYFDIITQLKAKLSDVKNIEYRLHIQCVVNKQSQEDLLSFRSHSSRLNLPDTA